MKRVIASFLLMSILLYIPGCRSYDSDKSSVSSLEQPSLSDNQHTLRQSSMIWITVLRLDRML